MLPRNLNILAVLLIFRRDSDSLFVFEEAAPLSVVVVDEVLSLGWLFSFELTVRKKKRIFRWRNIFCFFRWDTECF